MISRFTSLLPDLLYGGGSLVFKSGDFGNLILTPCGYTPGIYLSLPTIE